MQYVWIVLIFSRDFLKKATKQTDDDFEHADVIEWIDELKRLEGATYFKNNQLSILRWPTDDHFTPSPRLEVKVLQLSDYEAITAVIRFISSAQANSSEIIENLMDQNCNY